MKSTVFPDPSRGGRARQEQKDQCDVNLIVAAHRRGAVPTHVIQRVAEHGFVPAMTFQEAMNQVREAQELFEQVPAATRKAFGNDPGRFIEYCNDPKKKAELLEHGLLIPKPKAEPVLGSAENPIHTRPLSENPPIG